MQSIGKGVFKVGQLSLPGGVRVMTGTGAPVDGTTGTGAGKAGPGSIYVRTSNGAVYSNTNTLASPAWVLFGTIGTLTDGHIFVGQSGTATDVEMSGDATIDNAGALSLAENLVKYASASIASADITSTSAGKLGHANGFELVAAPAAGKALELLSAVLIYDYAGAAYASGGDLSIRWGGGGAAITGVVSAANSLGAAADKIVQFVPLATAANALSVATGLNLVAASAFTNGGSATGVVRVKVAYRVHTTGL